MQKLTIEGIETMSKEQMQNVIGGSCSVTCNAGYYSCCTAFDCDCRENGTTGACSSGGTGSTSCSQGPEDH